VDPSGMSMSDPYVPAVGGFTKQDYANYLQAQKGIANLLADKNAIAELLERNQLDREEFIDNYIDELYGPGRMNDLREGLKVGLKELGYQVALEVGTHYGSAGLGWIGGRILSWAAKRFKIMRSAWRGSRVVGKALQEGTEAASEQMSRASPGAPGTTPLRGAPQASVSLLDEIVADANRAASPGGAITESQATIIRQNLPVVQRRGSAATQQIRREFVSRQADLIAEWEAQTGRTWPLGATPHHIIPLESGGANAWWNLMPTHGSLPNHSLPGTPGPHAAGGVLRGTIQQGRRALPPGTTTDLRRPQ